MANLMVFNFINSIKTYLQAFKHNKQSNTDTVFLYYTLRHKDIDSKAKVKHRSV